MEFQPHARIEALRVSPRYTVEDWQKLNPNSSRDRRKAAAIVRNRLHGRFLRFASICLKSRHSEFVVLAIDSLLAETIQQFKDGVTEGHCQSKKLVERFLEGKRFQPDFDAAARKAFYLDIRCGLLHQAEARNIWLVRREQPVLLQKLAWGQGYIIDVERFHAAVEGTLDDYLKLLRQPANSSLRENLWKKMTNLCDVRKRRGALCEADPEPGVDQ